MKKILLFLFLTTLFGCGQKETENKIQISKPMTEKKNKKATGIGGIFFKCKDTEKMREWYGKNLGLVTNEYGSVFEFRNSDNPEQKIFSGYEREKKLIGNHQRQKKRAYQSPFNYLWQI